MDPLIWCLRFRVTLPPSFLVKQVLLDYDDEVHVVRRRQSVEQVFENELPLPDSFA